MLLPTVTFQCDEPAQLVLRVGVEDLADQKTYYNDYNIWVYRFRRSNTQC